MMSTVTKVHFALDNGFMLCYAGVMEREIINSIGYAATIVFYVIGGLILVTLSIKKRTRTEQLRDAKGRYTYKFSGRG